MAGAKDIVMNKTSVGSLLIMEILFQAVLKRNLLLLSD